MRMRLWNVADASEERDLPRLSSADTCVSFSGDGALLLAGCTDGGVLRFDMRRRELLEMDLSRHSPSYALSRLALSPDGRIAYTGSAERRLPRTRGPFSRAHSSIWGIRLPARRRATRCMQLLEFAEGPSARAMRGEVK